MRSDAAPLTCFQKGQHVQIEWLALEEEHAQRLRELGVREGCRVCVMLNADKCILGIGACRLALQREVAMRLFAVPA
ncbi:MAG: FeoA family protein [Rhodothermus sp.]|nr:FeoA family protein [Rhodothermus sp.]